MKKLYSVPLERDEGPQIIEIEISNPPSWNARFLEHEFDRVERVSKERVLAYQRNILFISTDLGETWRSHKFKKMRLIRNSFICSNGNILVSGIDKKNPEAIRISVLKGKKIIASNIVGRHGWHATFSIDENNECIMFSEYPVNFDLSYKRRFEVITEYNETGILPEDEIIGHENTTAHVYRSTDSGLSWQVVFEVKFPLIRHFHTCTSIPQTNNWLITSGDDNLQCRFWLTKDNGENWVEITDQDPLVNTASNFKKGIHRTVVMHLDENYFYWATDDFLGEEDYYDKGHEKLVWTKIKDAVEYRVLIKNVNLDIFVAKEIIQGNNQFIFEWKNNDITHEYIWKVQYRTSKDGDWLSREGGLIDYMPVAKECHYFQNSGDEEVVRSRLVRCLQQEPISVEVLCELGMHIRSMIDIGEAFILISEAKYLQLCPAPQVFLVFKDDMSRAHHLFNIPNPNNLKTGATISLSSISARDGVFFTQMQRRLLSDSCEFVRWKVTLK